MRWSGPVPAIRGTHGGRGPGEAPAEDQHRQNKGKESGREIPYGHCHDSSARHQGADAEERRQDLVGHGRVEVVLHPLVGLEDGLGARPDQHDDEGQPEDGHQLLDGVRIAE